MCTVIDVLGVNKKLNGRTVLQDVSLRIEQGEKVALIGPNGAGKTTLIRIILGLLRPDTGKVRVFGVDPYKETDIFLRPRIGVVLEKDVLWPYVTVSKALALNTRIFGLQDEFLVNSMISLFSLEKWLSYPIGNCSKGTVRRLSNVLALLNSPQLLVLDEPMSGLDPEWRIKLRNTISSLQTSSVLLSSHELHELRLMTQKIVVISEGKIKAKWITSEFKSDSEIEQKYLEVISSKEGP